MIEKKPKPVSKFEGMQPRQVVEHLRREGASLTCSLEPVDAEHLAALLDRRVGEPWQKVQQVTSDGRTLSTFNVVKRMPDGWRHAPSAGVGFTAGEADAMCSFLNKLEAGEP